MRLIQCLFTVMVMMFATDSYSAIQRIFQDVKLPTQKVLEHQTITNAGTTTTANILSASAGPTSAAVAVVSSFLVQPDVPRNLVITPGGTTADVGTCTLTVTGTNYFGRTITEAFAFAANASSATTGAKAFKTITSASFAAACEDSPFGATWSIGWGEVIGLKRCMTNAGHWVQSTVDGAFESTRATIVADADEVEKNTANFNGTLNGAADFEAFFVQNFGCLP